MDSGALGCPGRLVCRRVGNPHTKLAPAVAAGLALAAATAAPGASADAVAGLEPVVVVATRTARPLREVAGEVTVVTADDLAMQLATGLDDAFRYTPGIDVEGGGTRFGSESVSIRGIGGNRVAIELDGVPLPDQFDIGNFSNAVRDFADVGPVEQIEVLKGPASALYGSAAVGGVVAIRTRDPWLASTAEEGWQGALAQGWDSGDSSRHTRATVATSGSRWASLAGISVRRGGEREAGTLTGPADQHDYHRTTGFARLALGDPGAQELSLDLYRQSNHSTTDIQSLPGQGRFASTTALRGDDESDFSMAALGGSLESPVDWLDQATLRVFHMDTRIRQDTLDERAAATRPVRIDRNFSYDQRAVGVSMDLRRDLAAGDWLHRLAVGIDWTDHRTDEIRDGRETGLDDGLSTTVVLGESFPLRDFPVSDTSSLGAYAQDEAIIGPFTFIGALRFDRYELDPRVDAVYREDNPQTEPVALTLSEVSPKLGAIYRISERAETYLQYAHGFRAPPFEDANIGLYIPLFGIRAIPNPDLQAERSDGLDMGVRWRGEQFRMTASLFGTDYDNFIETKARIGVDPDTGFVLFQSRNVRKARIYGGEFTGSWSLRGRLHNLALDGAAFWARGENRDTREPLNSLGPAQATLGLTFSLPKQRLVTRLVGTFTRRWSDRDQSAGTLFEAPGHALVDVFVSHQITGRLSWQAGLSNVFDRSVWRWSDIRGLTPGDPLLPTLGQPGRSVALGLRWGAPQL